MKLPKINVVEGSQEEKNLLEILQENSSNQDANSILLSKLLSNSTDHQLSDRVRDLVGEEAINHIRNKESDIAYASLALDGLYRPNEYNAFLQSIVYNGFEKIEKIENIILEKQKMESLEEEIDLHDDFQFIFNTMKTLFLVNSDKVDIHKTLFAFLDLIDDKMKTISSKCPSLSSIMGNLSEIIKKNPDNPFEAAMPSVENQKIYLNTFSNIYSIFSVFIKDLKESYTLKNQKKIDELFSSFSDTDKMPRGLEYEAYSELFGQLKIAFLQISEER